MSSQKINPASSSPAEEPTQAGFGRIPVAKVGPVIEHGTYPAKAVVGQSVTVRANVFREGHDAVSASVVLIDPDGREFVTDMQQIEPLGLDIWEGRIRPDAEGDWTFRIEGWSDPWATWHHHAEAKLPVAVDTELVCMEGNEVLRRAADIALAAGDHSSATVLRSAGSMLLPDRPADELLEVANTTAIQRAMKVYRPRDLVSPTRAYPLRVERRLALYSSWYEFFPRSQGAWWDEDQQRWHSGNFDSSWERLDAAAAMGFTVVYLPPIHPIGTAFRKGRNNSLTPSEHDPGSPWAIGNVDGGHDAIHPDLGDFDSFDRFVNHAKELGMEVALDFALQASPDHPWVTTNPEWFTTRLDGTIAYAENPPKKYQDIYPINFDNDPAGIYAESLRILRLWISHGVTIFRVDNPHTKPVEFWGWIIDQVRRTNPEVIFLAEAFTRPEMMHALGKVGFQQSYTYFTWRNEKWELEQYMAELTGEMSAFYRPNFFVNTPDINPTFLQSGNPAAFAIRAILAATLSPTWGVYSGFEVCEGAVFKYGGEEYLNSEKYEYRPRNFNAEPNLGMLIGRLNEVRDQHPALQQLTNLTFHHAPHEQVTVFSKSEGEDRVIVICSLNPEHAVETDIYLDLPALGLSPHDVFKVRDELTGGVYSWGGRNFARLSPGAPAHILTILS
ncbi:MAG TPA: alpha-1,4-glucan--maltose-1-phosphate maltosyltransferase [Propionibacteriaceae bacterium]|nr:alpha-1,4-glucan--maltose-1-phosphate maltosyltransferase [Propionibacteriaceae bacterium]